MSRDPKLGSQRRSNEKFRGGYILSAILQQTPSFPNTSLSPTQRLFMVPRAASGSYPLSSSDEIPNPMRLHTPFLIPIYHHTHPSLLVTLPLEPSSYLTYRSLLAPAAALPTPQPCARPSCPRAHLAPKVSMEPSGRDDGTSSPTSLRPCCNLHLKLSFHIISISSSSCSCSISSSLSRAPHVDAMLAHSALLPLPQQGTYLRRLFYGGSDKHALVYRLTHLVLHVRRVRCPNLHRSPSQALSQAATRAPWDFGYGFGH